MAQNRFKTVLGLQSGDKESASSWREFFKNLKQRELNTDDVLWKSWTHCRVWKVFKEEFTHANTQRCQFHEARNLLAKVPKKLKKEVADEIRSIFYASSKKKAQQFFRDFEKKDTARSLFSRHMSRKLLEILPDIPGVSGRCVEFKNYHCHRTLEQGIQAKNQTDENRHRGERMLKAAHIHQSENGGALV